MNPIRIFTGASLAALVILGCSLKQGRAQIKPSYTLQANFYRQNVVKILSKRSETVTTEWDSQTEVVNRQSDREYIMEIEESQSGSPSQFILEHEKALDREEKRTGKDEPVKTEKHGSLEKTRVRVTVDNGNVTIAELSEEERKEGTLRADDAARNEISAMFGADEFFFLPKNTRLVEEGETVLLEEANFREKFSRSLGFDGETNFSLDKDSVKAKLTLEKVVEDPNDKEAGDKDIAHVKFEASYTGTCPRFPKMKSTCKMVIHLELKLSNARLLKAWGETTSSFEGGKTGGKDFKGNISATFENQYTFN